MISPALSQTPELVCYLDQQNTVTIWSTDTSVLSQTPELACYLDQQNTFAGWSNDTPAFLQTPELACSSKTPLLAGLMTPALSKTPEL